MLATQQASRQAAPMDRPWFPKLDDKLRERIGLVGTTVLIFMAAIGILFFGDALGRYSGYWDAQHERHADHYQNETTNEVHRCLSGPKGPSGVQKCVEDAVKASHENQRDERDLSAQRQMAKWAWWLLIITAVQAPLTALGLLFILITIWQGREALQTARESAAEAKRIGEAQTRCYLSIEQVKMTIRSDGLIDLYVSIKNSGQSPARDVEASYMVEFKVLMEETKQEIVGTIASNKGKFPIPALSTASLPKQTCPEGVSIEIEAAAADEDKLVSTSVYLLVKWIDVFDLKFESVERFSRPNFSWSPDKEMIVPSERDVASAVLSEIAKRRHRGEWEDDD